MGYLWTWSLAGVVAIRPCAVLLWEHCFTSCKKQHRFMVLGSAGDKKEEKVLLVWLVVCHQHHRKKTGSSWARISCPAYPASELMLCLAFISLSPQPLVLPSAPGESAIIGFHAKCSRGDSWQLASITPPHSPASHYHPHCLLPSLLPPTATREKLLALKGLTWL